MGVFCRSKHREPKTIGPSSVAQTTAKSEQQPAVHAEQSVDIEAKAVKAKQLQPNTKISTGSRALEKTDARQLPRVTPTPYPSLQKQSSACSTNRHPSCLKCSLCEAHRHQHQQPLAEAFASPDVPYFLRHHDLYKAAPRPGRRRTSLENRPTGNRGTFPVLPESCERLSITVNQAHCSGSRLTKILIHPKASRHPNISIAVSPTTACHKCFCRPAVSCCCSHYTRCDKQRPFGGGTANFYNVVSAAHAAANPRDLTLCALNATGCSAAYGRWQRAAVPLLIPSASPQCFDERICCASPIPSVESTLCTCKTSTNALVQPALYYSGT